jgi:hypothetical protein
MKKRRVKSVFKFGNEEPERKHSKAVHYLAAPCPSSDSPSCLRQLRAAAVPLSHTVAQTHHHHHHHHRQHHHHHRCSAMVLCQRILSERGLGRRGSGRGVRRRGMILRLLMLAIWISRPRRRDGSKRRRTVWLGSAGVRCVGV